MELTFLFETLLIMGWMERIKGGHLYYQHANTDDNSVENV